MLNLVVAVVLVLMVAGVGWLTLAAPVRPRVAQIAFLLVAGFLLLNKVWSPQYSLWLLPLAVLARPKWRSLLLWQAAEALLWVPRMLWYLGTDNRGVEVEWFFLGVVVRDVAVRRAHGAGRARHPAARRRRRPDQLAGAPTTPPAGVLDGAPRPRGARHLQSARRAGYASQDHSGAGAGRSAQHRDLLGVGRGVTGGLEDDGAARGPRHLDQ